MPAQLIALCFDANDPKGLARFWAGVLGLEFGALPVEALRRQAPQFAAVVVLVSQPSA